MRESEREGEHEGEGQVQREGERESERECRASVEWQSGTGRQAARVAETNAGR